MRFSLCFLVTLTFCFTVTFARLLWFVRHCAVWALGSPSWQWASRVIAPCRGDALHYGRWLPIAGMSRLLAMWASRVIAPCRGDASSIIGILWVHYG